MDELKIPQHVAVILDGNGRWAKKRRMPRKYGHAQGAKAVEQVCENAWRMGIKYLTVYAFSTENWKRPEDEIDAIMKLFRDYLKNCLEISRKNDMRVRIIGDRSCLNEDIIKVITQLEEESKNNQGLNFQVALNYGSRDEITRAVKKIAQKIENGTLRSEEINETIISDELDTCDIPDPDLMIRTSGEQRLSNYMLWQLAYAEFYFTDVLWPDFDKKELEKAVAFYNKRDRRFGGV
ncbi:undecaprenyl diphosphate synthase [[Clostridium] polysaccharolyticum]|uniref:Isoprenyl transferase n=1 Tax=[Clostridium] polysaccharolyticum TaxID=29364 RepID=A0A1I0B442_9FIRM|nr:isoprenyl transferase [[Clostridium] polysaccharolyticum]SET01459.1 undecaprenyl diphosphate synthase [[Clostridium] polysaccharolyticum]